MSTIERNGATIEYSRTPPVPVVLVGQTPPPVHGQALAIQALAQADWADVAVHPVRLDMSDTLDQVGRASARKLARLWRCARQARQILRRCAPCVLYYPPGPPDAVPFVRDVLFLLAVRPAAAATVLHFHAGGIGAYVQSSSWRRIAGRAYRNAAIAVQPGRSCPPDGELLGAREVRFVPAGIAEPGVQAAGPGESLMQERPFRVLFVGHLCPEKGVGLLPRIAQRLGKRATIEVIGGWRSETFRNHMEPSLRLPNLSLAGECHDADKWSRFAQADVLLLPSFRETQGLVAVEAMACGIPVVASDIPGLRDVVNQGVEGQLVKPGDADGFADAILEICQSARTWKAMSEAGRRRYLADFTLETYRASMRKVFRDAWQMAAGSAAAGAEEHRRGGMAGQDGSA